MIAAAALVSCSREPLTLSPAEEFGPNTIAFTLQETPDTRAGGLISTTNISLGTTESGEPIYLQERVTRLGGLSRVPATKAALATNANVGSLYGAFYAKIYDQTGEEPDIDSGGPFDFKYEANHAKWAHSFGSNPLGDDPLTFILAMPAIPTDFALNADGKIAFSYSTPDDAADQNDLLIAGVTLSNDKEDDNYYNPAAGFGVTFQHALTGVKFAIANTANGTKITKVTLTGIKSSGSAVANIVDIVETDEDHSIVWTPGTTTAEFSLALPDGTYEDDDDINDDYLSYTFWFVPQTLSDNASIAVTFSVNGGDEETYSVKLNEALGETVTWKAGELHTFSLSPEVVDVGIDDYNDKTIKSDVVISNTGNVPIYVRVNLIGNWVGKREYAEGKLSGETVLMGYTDDTMQDEVARWNDKDNDATWVSPTGRTYPYTPYGTFTGLPPKGTTTAGGTEVNGWIRHDKYYYYKIAIDPGDSIGGETSTELFEEYKITRIPTFWINDNTGTPREAQDVHLVMDVIVQAILAPMDADGNPVGDYKTAWIAALNPDDDSEFNFNDL